VFDSKFRLQGNFIPHSLAVQSKIGLKIGNQKRVMSHGGDGKGKKYQFLLE
jgi:hypothetical protein